MIERKELKERAKEYAFNNKWLIWKPILLTFAVSFCISFIFGLIMGIFGVSEDSYIYGILYLILTIALLPVSVGTTLYIMKTIKGETVDLKELWKKKYESIVPIIVSSSILIFALYILLCITLTFIFMYITKSLFILIIIPLLLIGVIIIELRFSQLQFVLAETEKDKNVLYPIKESFKLMKGHTGNYFVFLLSFIGWILLGYVTLGIALIWVIPYIQVASIYYYEELKKIQK